jgi:hypothetical protein
MINLDPLQSTVVIIPAIEPWFHTGILLKKAHTYKMEVIPNNQVWKDGRTLGEFTADGKRVLFLMLLYPFIRMPLVKWFALLGCINGKRKTYFKIGKLLENYQPPEDGELICFANDALGFYKHNNSGEMVLTITRIG